jgi:hypothetical protein
MKSAYELAMERLSRSEPSTALSDSQKQALAELNDLYRAKRAERETFLHSKITAAKASGNFAEAEEIQSGLARDLRALDEELELKKEKIRKEKS